MDPCTHRLPVTQLSKRCGAPALSVRYRLAPQHPFPAPLVDGLVAYLSLISPPPGSFHKPVAANRIVFMGDSAGGNLSLGLVQALLALQRRGVRSIRFHGRDVPLELPAGVAGISPWCDMTRSMPSVFRNAPFDYLPPPPEKSYIKYTPLPWPEDDVWPVQPPRLDPVVNADSCVHPMVSPLAARKEVWEGAPPIFFSIGEELLTDECLITARRINEAGVPITVEQYEGMAHCYGFIILNTPTSKRIFEGLANFFRGVTAGYPPGVGNAICFGSQLRWMRQVPLEKLPVLGDKEIDDRLRKSRLLRMEEEGKVVAEWKERARL